MTTLLFPKTLAAVRKAEGDQWAIGDALIQEIGPLPKDGKNDGSSARLKECSAELRTQGHSYTAGSLAVIRQVAGTFAPPRRIGAIPFWTHAAAGTPEVLSEVVRRVKEDKTGDLAPTHEFATQVGKSMRRVQAAANKAEKAERKAYAERAAEEAKEAAATAAKAKAEDRERAEQEAERKAQEAAAAKTAARSAPAKQPAPEPGHIDRLVLLGEITLLAQQATVLAGKAHKKFNPDYFEDEELTEIEHAFQKAANAWAGLAVRRTNPRHRLEVVS